MTDPTDKLLEDRAKTYGDFKKNAEIWQKLGNAAYDSALCSEHKLALTMIYLKVARILSGNYDHKDNWDDIAGYAKLGSLACKTKS